MLLTRKILNTLRSVLSDRSSCIYAECQSTNARLKLRLLTTSLLAAALTVGVAAGEGRKLSQQPPIEDSPGLSAARKSIAPPPASARIGQPGDLLPAVPMAQPAVLLDAPQHPRQDAFKNDRALLQGTWALTAVEWMGTTTEQRRPPGIAIFGRPQVAFLRSFGGLSRSRS